MADDTKQFPPSEYKLQQLRREGIIPYSSLLTTAAVLVGCGVGVFFLWKAVPGILIQTFRDGAGEVKASPDVWLTTQLGELLKPVGGALLIVCLVALVVGLIQTRFFFSFGRLFSFSRFPFRLGFAPIFSGFRFVLGRLPHLIVFAVIVWVMMRRHLFINFDSLPVLGTDGAQASLTIWGDGASRALGGGGAYSIGDLEGLRHLISQTLVDRIVPIAAMGLAVAAILGLLSRLAAHVEYRNRHRMSRAEVEAEIREMEMSPELRRGVRDQFGGGG